jgi:DNA-binding transcriptional regulator YiaG
MSKERIQKLIERKEKIERGEVCPAAVWDVRSNDHGGFTSKKISPQRFQRLQKIAWDKSIAATRKKLGLSQRGFADMLGISVRTLHHWEQGARKPSGAARVLLRIAEKHPEMVLDAAA